MNAYFEAPRKELVSSSLACLVLLLGLGTGKAFADDDHDRLRRDQRKNQQGQQNQGQQPQGQHQQQPQRQQEQHQQGQQHQPPQGQPQQHQQPQYQPPQQQHQPQPRQEPRWGGPRPGERHDEHEHQGMPGRPEPAPMQHGRAAPEMQHPGRPPAPPPRFEHERPMPAPPAHVEHGRPMPSAPPPRFDHPRPMPPMHMGRPLAPAQPMYVEMAPPRARYEVRPPRPSPMHIWIGGYWGWENDTHVWIGGEWAEPPEPGYVWEAPRWRRHGHRWAYSPGYWRHRGGPVYAPPMGAAPAPAYSGGITISGRVMSMQGAPVPGIVVTLAGTQEGQIVTDGSGAYAFSGLPQGSYAVRPTGGGCAFAPDVANLNNLYDSVTQDIIVSGCGGW